MPSWLMRVRNQLKLIVTHVTLVGLGKTIQTISLITMLKEKGLNQAPHLVVVPSSSMFIIILSHVTYS